MSKPTFRIEAGFLRYPDDSGYAVDVVIEQEYEGGEINISINTGWRFDAEKWPAVRDGIERMLKAAPEVSPHDGAPHD